MRERERKRENIYKTHKQIRKKDPRREKGKKKTKIL